MKKTFAFLITFILLAPMVVFAESDSSLYTTKSGITMERQLYDELCKIYSKGYVETMNEAIFNGIKDNDLSEVKISEYYSQPFMTLGSYFGSSAKNIRIVKNGNYILVTVAWAGVPANKSYDIMAVRLFNTSIVGEPLFQQLYVADGDFQVSYDGNVKNFSNGYGNSFKLASGTSLEIDLTFMISGSGVVFATYQHAMVKVTLSESMSYTLSNIGLGGVVKFSDKKIEEKYDEMTGVDLDV